MGPKGVPRHAAHPLLPPQPPERLGLEPQQGCKLCLRGGVFHATRLSAKGIALVRREADATKTTTPDSPPRGR